MPSDKQNSIADMVRVFHSRTRQRFPLNLPLSGVTVGSHPSSFYGETANLSSQGIQFTVNKPLPLNAVIELEIEWPVRGESGEALQLRGCGTVVRCADNLVAARIWGYVLGAKASARMAGN